MSARVYGLLRMNSWRDPENLIQVIRRSLLRRFQPSVPGRVLGDPCRQRAENRATFAVREQMRPRAHLWAPLPRRLNRIVPTHLGGHFVPESRASRALSGLRQEPATVRFGSVAVGQIQGAPLRFGNVPCCHVLPASSASLPGWFCRLRKAVRSNGVNSIKAGVLPERMALAATSRGSGVVILVLVLTSR